MGLYSDNLYACFSNDQQCSKLCVCIVSATVKEQHVSLFLIYFLFHWFWFVQIRYFCNVSVPSTPICGNYFLPLHKLTGTNTAHE